MSTEARRPIDWVAPSDPTLDTALDRQRDLHARWRQAQADAIEAAEALTRAASVHQTRRAQALAEGKRDPGVLDTTALERAATDAATTRDVLGEAFGRARAVLALADERQEVWEQAASERLEAARAKLLDALDVFESERSAFEAAFVEVALARDAALQERPAAKARALVPTAPSIDELRRYAALSRPCAWPRCPSRRRAGLHPSGVRDAGADEQALVQHGL